jgi:hypothetical protein
MVVAVELVLSVQMLLQVQVESVVLEQQIR